ncbi:glycoside hydrolase family 27 protein [Microbacterium arborescens]|uniref:glycoside hydrolase family 27 protein n=1 Tax=Microbacterium arborescens TaxID=33883 RepID=UPI002784919B|nr:glycoside hydrolase family 27 protein [Microbacterium arborescens]MDQ1215577.1 alpha-galactosidase [Microbacterium arborescens]
MTDERRAAASRPPMGWNSWDCFGSSVTEAEVLANAEYAAEHLLAFGWDTIVVDIQWYEPDPGAHDYREVSHPRLDAWGRPLPAPGRFPSAAGGSFRPLADRIHELGLRFGVHLMRGVPRAAADAGLPVSGHPDATCDSIADRSSVCVWNPDNYGVDMTAPGAQEYYDSVMAQLAAWGVDFVKLDDVLYPPVETAEIAAISRAIDRSGRAMVLSLSPGKRLSLAHLETLRQHGQMWRISDDFWDDWSQVVEQFQRAARWAPFQMRGAWADADMLPFGRIGVRGHVGEDRLSRLSVEEQRTVMTLWSMMRSPLMMGGHLPDTPPETLALLCNPGVLALRDGEESREIVRDGDLVIWSARVDARAYRAVFWLGDDAQELVVHLADLGLGDMGTAGSCTDVWSGKSVEIADGRIMLTVPAHGTRLLVFD